MPPAARLTDMHVCPMVTGVVPHVGGPILAPGAPTVPGAPGALGMIEEGESRTSGTGQALRRQASVLNANHLVARGFEGPLSQTAREGIIVGNNDSHWSLSVAYARISLSRWLPLRDLIPIGAHPVSARFRTRVRPQGHWLRAAHDAYRPPGTCSHNPHREISSSV